VGPGLQGLAYGVSKLERHTWERLTYYLLTALLKWPRLTTQETPMRPLWTALAATLVVLASPAAIAGDGWIEDFDEAAALAKKEGKDLLVDFTGSDW